MTNGLNELGRGTEGRGDIDTQKDVLLGYDYLLDDIASGMTLFYYNGATHDQVSPLQNTFNYTRVGFNLSKWFRITDALFLEFQGGVHSKP